MHDLATYAEKKGNTASTWRFLDVAISQAKRLLYRLNGTCRGLHGACVEWRSGLIWRCLLEGLGRRSRRVPLASEGGWLSLAVDYLDFDVFEGLRCVGQSAVCCEEAGLGEAGR